MAQLFANNAAGKLLSGISDTDTTLTLQTSQGALFPSPSGGDFFLVTLFEAGETNHEIVRCTGRSGDALTVTRAQEGTTARTFATGTSVELRLTRDSIGQLNNTSVTTASLVAGTMGNTSLAGIKTATFNSQATIATTSGAITVDWTSAQNQKQAEPVGAITYTFTAPPGPCHLQLLVDSDGTSAAQTFTWPGAVIWMGSTWAATANKKSIINFWYDGANYYASGANQA